MRNLFRAALLASLIIVPFSASAHLAGGDDVDKDGYILDFGYDPSPPVAGKPAVFAFNLADQATETAVSPDSVWVRFVKDGAAPIAAVLAPRDGSATLTAALPDPGTYDVTARYSYGGREIEGSFTVTAGPRPSDGPVTKPPSDAARPEPADLARVLAATAVALGAYLLGDYRGRRESKKTH